MISAMPTGNRRKTATSPHILTHGKGNGRIETDDDALMLEALRIAGAHITREADACADILPGSPMVERLRVFAEKMGDLHSRLSA